MSAPKQARLWGHRLPFSQACKAAAVHVQQKLKGARGQRIVQESQGQPASFNQPSTAADAYASGGQNYYAAGWQAAQVSRPQTAQPARAPSFVPELWGARQQQPSSTAHAQLAPADGQVSMHASTYLSPQGYWFLLRSS